MHRDMYTQAGRQAGTHVHAHTFTDTPIIKTVSEIVSVHKFK